jgi:hypothetical protein
MVVPYSTSKRHSGGFAATDAQRGHAFCQATGLERVDERDHDAGTGCANGVAQRTGTAVDVHLVVRHVHVVHQGHGHHGKGLVDFPQVHIAHGPTGFGQGFFRRTHGGRSKPFRLLRVGGMCDDFCKRLAT